MEWSNYYTHSLRMCTVVLSPTRSELESNTRRAGHPITWATYGIHNPREPLVQFGRNVYARAYKMNTTTTTRLFITSVLGPPPV